MYQSTSQLTVGQHIGCYIFIESRSRLKETRMVVSCYSLLVNSWLLLC